MPVFFSKTLSSKQSNRGFTLVELMVTVAIIAVLAGIAWPIYSGYVVRTHRTSAAACLQSARLFMERNYAKTMNYAKDPDGDDTTLDSVSCTQSDNGPSQFYAFSLEAEAGSYTITATPGSIQAGADTKCGTLSIDQTGQEHITGTGTVSNCFGGS